MKKIEKNNYEKVYSVPVYIAECVKKLDKLRDKEEILLSQVNDYIRLTGLPKDVPFELLKYIPEDNVIPGQTKLDI